MPEPTNIEQIITKLQIQMATDEGEIVVRQDSVSF